jgi:hypothetical protein
MAVSVFVVPGPEAPGGGGASTGLRYQTAPGVHETRAVEFGPWHNPSTPLPNRLVRLDGVAGLVLQKVVTTELSAREPDAAARLENEIRALVRLRTRFGKVTPPELPELIGWDADTAEPFLLVRAPRGEPVSALAGQLMLSAQQAFQAGLLRGLLLLHGARLVHGAIGPETVRWDGQQVQVWDLTSTAVQGETLPAWARPGAVRVADPADDIRSAGVLIYHVETGEPVTGRPLLQPGTRLDTVLKGVFDAAPARPSIRDLLGRLRVDVEPLPGSSNPAPAFAAGQRRFDEIRAEKAAQRPRPVHHAPARGAGPARRPRRRVGVARAVLGVATVLVAAAALILLVVTR